MGMIKKGEHVLVDPGTGYAIATITITGKAAIGFNRAGIDKAGQL